MCERGFAEDDLQIYTTPHATSLYQRKRKKTTEGEGAFIASKVLAAKEISKMRTKAILLIFIRASHFGSRQTIQNEDNEGIMKELFIFMTDSKRKEPNNNKKKKNRWNGASPLWEWISDPFMVGHSQDSSSTHRILIVYFPFTHEFSSTLITKQTL